MGGLILSACAADSAVPDALPATLVTDDEALTRLNEASNVLVDADDPDLVYLSQVDLLQGDCRFHASSDGGRSWEEREPPVTEPYTNCTLGLFPGSQNVRTELQQTPDGTILYAFQAQDPAGLGSRSVFLARSNDGGRSWTTAPIHAAPRAEEEEEVEFNIEVHVAFDPDAPDRIVATWRRSFPSVADLDRPTRPYIAVSEDGGETFSEPRVMLEENIGFDGPRPVLANDRLYAFYRVRPSEDGAPERAMVGVSEDLGETWEETTIAEADDIGEPVPGYDRQSGTFYAVWHDNNNGDLDVFFSRSSDAASWSEPVRLNDDEEGNRVGQYYPQMGVADGGRIDVAWYDYRNDLYGPPSPSDPDEPLGLGSNLGNFQSVFWTRSTDGGDTWTDNVGVNDARIDRTIGTWNRDFFVVVPVSVDVRGDDSIVSWSDTRNGNAETGRQDIYAAVVATDTAGGDGTSAALVVGLLVAGLLVGAGLAALVGVGMLRRSRAPAA